LAINAYIAAIGKMYGDAGLKDLSESEVYMARTQWKECSMAKTLKGQEICFWHQAKSEPNHSHNLALV
jgi:hypothetical protein